MCQTSKTGYSVLLLGWGRSGQHPDAAGLPAAHGTGLCCSRGGRDETERRVGFK